MKKIIYGLLLFPSLLKAQGTEFAFLETNNIRARTDYLGRLFNDESLNTAGFEVPAGSGNNTIYISGLWMGGYRNNSLKCSAQSFQDGDFQQGPVMDASWYNSQLATWQRVWKITKNDLEYHQQNFTNPGYVMPEAIENWPAHGDVSKGQAYYLAPFWDVNANGIYDPGNGDYPKIKGDDAIYMIFNDDKLHLVTGGSPYKMEIHAMLYAFECSDYNVLNNTVFVEYKIINRSNYNYTDNYIGMWTDFDIGCSNDDFIASDVQRSMFYGYNGDGTDGACSGSPGFGDYVPMTGVVFLDGPKQIADGIDNPLTNNVQYAVNNNGIVYSGTGNGFGDGVVDNERLNMRHFMYYFRDDVTPLPAQGEPSNANDFYRYIKGIWQDNTPVYYGGSGHQTSPGAIQNGLLEYGYMFPGSSDPLYWGSDGVPFVTSPWSEISEGNVPADRRGVGSTGPFNFNPGETITIQFAFVYAASSTPNDSLSALPVLQQRADALHTWYNLNGTPCGGSFGLSAEEVEPDVDVSVFPNPASEFIMIQYPENFSPEITLSDISGREILFSQEKISSSQLRISLSEISAGSYFIVLRSGETTMMKKIIKQ
ncbi:MAG: T9SS type A sorting domain-containing protein [Bacteroidota bacterium]